MREIKFRQWIGEEFQHWGVGIDGISYVGPCSGLGGSRERIDNTCHQQYTGLTDKNGVEIYEGDILSIAEVSPLLVEFCDGRFGYSSTDNNQGFSGLVQDRTRRLLVIGNIHENPELLESTND